MRTPRGLDLQARLPLAAGAVMLWVALGPWLWGFASSRSAVADHVFLVFAFGPLALLVVALRPAAIVTLAGAGWLILSPWVLGYATNHAAWADELATGLLLAILSLRALRVNPYAFAQRRRAAQRVSSGAAQRMPSRS